MLSLKLAGLGLVSLMVLLPGPSLASDDSFPYRPNYTVPTLYVLRGQTLNLTVINETRFNVSKIFWWKSRQWNETRGDTLTLENNCSWRPALMGRIDSCNTTLLLKNADWSDAGIYRFRYRNAYDNNTFFWFNVSVYDTQPALGILGMSRWRTILQCYDLRNPMASLELQNMTAPNATSPVILTNRTDFYTVGIDGSTSYGVWVRCCASFHGHQNCTPWRYIYQSIYLPLNHSKNPVCKNRQKPTPYPAYQHQSPVSLLPANCTRSNYSQPKDKFLQTKFDFCEHVPSIIHTYPETNYLEFYRPLGGFRRVSTYFPNPRRNDTGKYKVEQGRQISIQVLPQLNLTVELYEVFREIIRLNCAHNGRRQAKVEWEIKGHYGKHEVHRTGPFGLSLWASCWRTSGFSWLSSIELRCRVTDGPWTGVSRWFWVWAEKTPDYSSLRRKK